jgi:hypothetical protein
MGEEANLVKAYRQSRRDFIARCRKADADTIARVHPALAPDGGPLFCDSAALGPRDARRGLLLAGAETPGDWLADLMLPVGTKLVVVHALDPFVRAWGKPGKPVDWPETTLSAIATEDLSKVTSLTVFGLKAKSWKLALSSALPKAVMVFRQAATEMGIRAAIAGL